MKKNKITLRLDQTKKQIFIDDNQMRLVEGFRIDTTTDVETKRLYTTVSITFIDVDLEVLKPGDDKYLSIGESPLKSEYGAAVFLGDGNEVLGMISSDGGVIADEGYKVKLLAPGEARFISLEYLDGEKKMLFVEDENIEEEEES